MSELSRKKNGLLWVSLVILLHGALCLLVWNAGDINYISDEGSYLVLGKSLAQDGYRFISWPEEPRHGKYPPVFPFLLSVVWRILPNFPANVPWFRGINILLGAVSLWVLDKILTGGCSLGRWERLTILFLVGVHPAILYYSTSIHSEPLYLLVAGAILAHAAAILPSRLSDPQLGFKFGLLISFLLYVRLAGITLASAILLYFLAHRSYRNLWRTGLVLSILFVPWLMWIWFNSAEMSYRGFTFYSDYFRDWKQTVYDHGWRQLLVRNSVSLFFGIPKTCFFPFQTNLETITQLTFWLGIPFLYFLLRGFVTTWNAGVNRLLHLYTITSLAVFLVWPYEAQERFLGLLLPFFYVFFLAGTRKSLGLTAVTGAPVNSYRHSFVSWLFIGLLSLSLGYHALQYCYGALQNRLASEQQRDFYSCVGWIAQKTGTADTLLADLDTLFYLHTGRKTLPLALSLEKIQGEWTVSNAAIRRTGASYLVRGKDDFLVLGPGLRVGLRETIENHMLRNSERFQSVFTSSHSRYQIYSLSEVNDIRWSKGRSSSGLAAGTMETH